MLKGNLCKDQGQNWPKEAKITGEYTCSNVNRPVYMEGLIQSPVYGQRVAGPGTWQVTGEVGEGLSLVTEIISVRSLPGLTCCSPLGERIRGFMHQQSQAIPCSLCALLPYGLFTLPHREFVLSRDPHQMVLHIQLFHCQETLGHPRRGS